jgi:hypothetical protein
VHVVSLEGPPSGKSGESAYFGTGEKVLLALFAVGHKADKSKVFLEGLD